LDLDPATGPGALLWRAAAAASTLEEMREAVEHAQADRESRRVVHNHLGLAEQWGVFHPDGLDANAVLGESITVVDTSAIGERPLAAVTAALARQLYDVASTTGVKRLPWLLIDEAHTVTDGVAGPALKAILTRGRHPGVSLVLATQRPSALPPVAISQADLVVSHRLTSSADIASLSEARPTYLDGTIVDRLPEAVGEAIVIDDATEAAVTVGIRERDTPHAGGSPKASEVSRQDKVGLAVGGGI
jgi:hypothetical protein